MVEHNGRIGGLGHAETHLERVQHLLHAGSRPFLLLDAVLETVDLFLQLAVGFFQLGTIAEQRQDAIVLRFRSRFVLAKRELEKTELSQCLHER